MVVRFWGVDDAKAIGGRRHRHRHAIHQFPAIGAVRCRHGGCREGRITVVPGLTMAAGCAVRSLRSRCGRCRTESCRQPSDQNVAAKFARSEGTRTRGRSLEKYSLASRSPAGGAVRGHPTAPEPRPETGQAKRGLRRGTRLACRHWVRRVPASQDRASRCRARELA